MRPDDWHLTDDVDSFLARAGDFLHSRPALHTIPPTVTEALRTRGAHAYGAEDPPHLLNLTPLTPDESDALAAHLAGLGRHWRRARQRCCCSRTWPTPPATACTSASATARSRTSRCTTSSRTPLGCSGSWVWAGGGRSWQGAMAGGAGTGPAVQQVLDGVEDLVEGEPAVSAFGARRCSVRNACAAVTRVTWWCQPAQERPSKWSRPRPCLSSR
jgi:hypothetical protein